MADVGTGATITFVTSAITMQVRGPVEFSGTEREAIDITHLATTNFRLFMPSDLIDLGEMSFEVLFDPLQGDSLRTLMGAAAETIRLTFPMATGQTTATKLEFSGFATGVEYGIPLEEVMTATLTLKASGASYTWTDGS